MSDPPATPLQVLPSLNPSETYLVFEGIQFLSITELSRFEETSRSRSPTCDLTLTSPPVNHIPKLYI